MAIEDEALELLHALADPDATFRDGQYDAIHHLVERRRHVLCVQRTGWGKSAVYFIATRLLRDRGSGPTVLISPLIALMRNQIEAATRIGIRAATVNSATVAEWDRIFESLEDDEVDLLLISPERLNNEAFRTDVLPGFIDRIGLLVIDEAHCISDWGHDFRPDYRRIRSLIGELDDEAAVLCTTATANNRVIADIQEQLGGMVLLTVRGTLDRPSLRLEALDIPSQAERLAWLATFVPALGGSGIVYCLTVRDTINVAAWLRAEGIDAEAYSGETDDETRIAIEQKLLGNEVKAVVATSALGMGYDKPDLGFVVHFQSPGSPIAYYQQVGRAGRQLGEAHAVLLRGREDREIQDFFISQAFPPEERVQSVVDLLDRAGGPVKLNDILTEVNIGKGRLEAILKTLEVDGVVRRAGGGYARTEESWTYDGDRVERVTATRRDEQAAMDDYGRAQSCLMRFLRRQLDDAEAQACGRCSVCTSPRFAAPLDRDLVVAAVEHIRDRPVVFVPRKQWPSGTGLGRIPEDVRTGEGRALSVYADAGWGSAVRDGKFSREHFDDALVDASARLIASWAPDPPPTWVTAVPSLRRPELVPDFAARLASACGLPFHPVVRKVTDTAPQKHMLNSQQQALNVRGSFAIDGAPPDGPALLVDDMVDSRWTFTVVGALLREAGVPAIHPFALASTAVRG